MVERVCFIIKLDILKMQAFSSLLREAISCKIKGKKAEMINEEQK